MTAGGRTTSAVLVALGTFVAGASAQSPTGLEKVPKPSASSAEAMLAVGDLRWAQWSDEVLVALWVHQPIKAMGMWSFDEEQRVALNTGAADAEAGVREVLQGMRSGEIDPASAANALRTRLRNWSSALGELASTR